jgi:general L-amino acid transport system permease protein
MLNTLKVAVLGIFMATILGTLIGVGRLSPNWLLAKVCEGYVEMFRNVPLLLWLFLIYKLISEAFPGPRQAINVLNSFFLSNRGSTSRCRSPIRSINGWASPCWSASWRPSW